jgi:hypothetical protein
VLDAELRRHAPGDHVPLTVLPRGSSSRRTAEIALADDPRVVIVPVETNGGALSPEQREFRRAWLTSRVQRADP